ncbi:hypothetical protein BGZ98_004379 [Dissophora globulifera]|nr:hypothetical protein BGZ98_004379 [Dissophora globulifera]
MLVFVGAIGAATWRRAKYRSQFRQMQQRNMEGGRVLPGGKGSKKGGDAELSDAALFKQASMSKRALMTDVGPGGTITAHDAPVTKIAAANGAGRHLDESGAGISSIQSVRFGENNPNNRPPGTGRAGGMKASTRSNANQGDYEMNSYRQSDDLDTNDYSRPPLESADPYYSSGSSHSGYLDQVDNYQHRTSGSNTPQRPKLAYQQGSDSSSPPQPQYQQPTYVQRTNSSRMPKNELHDGNNIFRSDSGGRGGAATPSRGVERSGSGGSGYPARIATQGLLDRSGSGGRSATNSPIEGGMSRTGSSGSSARTRPNAVAPNTHRAVQ